MLRKVISKVWRQHIVAGLFASTMLAIGHVSAHDGAHAPSVKYTGAASKGATWVFTLATLEGDRFVRSSDFSGPILVNFWGRDCPPCIAELPRLQAFANANKDWTVVLIATDSSRDAKSFLNDRGITLTSLRAGTDTRALLRVAGNPSGALPYSHAQRKNEACFAKLGELSELDLNQLFVACSDAVSK